MVTCLCDPHLLSVVLAPTPWGVMSLDSGNLSRLFVLAEAQQAYEGGALLERAVQESLGLRPPPWC